MAPLHGAYLPYCTELNEELVSLRCCAILDSDTLPSKEIIAIAINIHKVLPFVGFGSVQLGMTRSSVERMLGVPDDISASDDGWAQIAWTYLALGVQLDFSATEDFLLGGVSFEKKLFEVNGVFPVGLTETELRALGANDVLPGLVLEDGDVSSV